MASTVKPDELNWQPIKTAPWQTIIWVRNKMMERPVKATRGHSFNGIVCENRDLFTSVYTPDPEGFFPTPAGRLVCPDEWAPCDTAEPDAEGRSNA